MLFVSILGLALKLDINQVQHDVVEAMIKNDGDAPLAILLPNTPFSGMKEDVLQIRQNGRRLKFVGQHVQWDQNKINSYSKTIQPGEVWSQNIDISQRYNTVNGLADIKLSFLYRECAFKNGTTELFACKLTRIIQSDEISVYVKTHKREKVTSPNYRTRNCYFTKWLKAKYALNQFQKIQRVAVADLIKGPSKAFTTFFGINDTATVLSVFEKTKKYKFDVECGSTECTMDGIYAFVYPETPTIFLCSQFFKTNFIGFNSKVGTLVHESTHFRQTGDTEDYAYGMDEAKRMASTSPELAIKNADNYEYFAESLYFKLMI